MNRAKARSEFGWDQKIQIKGRENPKVAIGRFARKNLPKSARMDHCDGSSETSASGEHIKQSLVRLLKTATGESGFRGDEWDILQFVFGISISNTIDLVPLLAPSLRFECSVLSVLETIQFLSAYCRVLKERSGTISADPSARDFMH
jgi:hypothetical protein